MSEHTGDLEPDIARGAFARLTAAGALGLSAAATGNAGAVTMDPGFGKPHAPIVAPDDRSITVDTTMIDYLDMETNARRKLNAYAAYPKTITPSTPGVVVVQAIWGVDAQLRDVVRRLGREGYIAIAPDLYTGLGAPSGDNTSEFPPFRDVAAKLSDQQVDRDLRAAATHLRVKADRLYKGQSNDPMLDRRRVGTLGFCMGGAIALRQAVDNGDIFEAAAVFYGKVRYGTTGNNGNITPIALAYANDIEVPFLGSYGAKDTSILAGDVQALSDRLALIDKPHDIKIYDEAGHAFFDDTRDTYVASAATDAWTRTLAFFHTHLAT